MDIFKKTLCIVVAVWCILLIPMVIIAAVNTLILSLGLELQLNHDIKTYTSMYIILILSTVRININKECRL